MEKQDGFGKLSGQGRFVWTSRRNYPVKRRRRSRQWIAALLHSSWLSDCSITFRVYPAIKPENTQQSMRRSKQLQILLMKT